MKNQSDYTNITEKDEIPDKRKKYIAMLLIAWSAAIIIVLFGSYFLKQYEKSIFSIYANQQDGYVKIINKQINLQSDRSNYDIIQNILGTLDNSDKTYWTMEEDQSVVYVKNVLETNKYKGVSPATVFNTASARKFLKALSKDHIVHAYIGLNNQKYVASGSSFSYNGKEYKLCLLTDESIILDNNTYLMAKTAIQILWVVIIGMFVIVTVIAIILLQQQNVIIQAKQQKIMTLNLKLDAINKENKLDNMFGSKWNVYQDIVLKKFIDSFEDKDLNRIVFCRIEFENDEKRDLFLNASSNRLDNEVLKFYYGEHDLMILFVRYTLDESENALARIDYDYKNVKWREYDTSISKNSLSVEFERFEKECISC